MKLFIFSGTEGPRYDPYAFDELHIERGSKLIVVHQGIGDWVDIDGVRHWVSGRAGADLVVKNAVGYTATQLLRYRRKADEARTRVHRAHGGVEWRSGFPGEALCLCRCGAVIDTTFNRSAIE